MKTRLALLCLALFLLLPCNAPAAEYGVYLAPKFIYAHTLLAPLKLSAELTGSPSSSASGTKSDDAFGGALALGYNFDTRFNVPVRAEIEYAVYSQVKGKTSGSGQIDIFTDFYGAKQELKIQTLFLNAYFDIKTGTAFTPWLGAGVGMAFVHSRSSAYYDFDYGRYRSLFEGSEASQNTTNFAWNVGAGIGWKVAESLTVDLGYRFVSLGEVENPTWSDVIGYTPVFIKSKTEHLFMHQALLALRFEF